MPAGTPAWRKVFELALQQAKLLESPSAVYRSDRTRRWHSMYPEDAAIHRPRGALRRKQN